MLLFVRSYDIYMAQASYPRLDMIRAMICRVRSAGNRQTSRLIAPSHADDPSTDDKRQEHVVP